MSAAWAPAVVAVIGGAVTVVVFLLGRRTTQESTEIQREATESRSRLDEVQALEILVNTLNGEVDRLGRNLHDANAALDTANGKAGFLNVQLTIAQRNVTVLRRALEMNGVPIPHLEAMHDVN